MLVAMEATDRFVVWTPRLLAIAFALFLATFALDGFDDDGVVGLLAGLIPAALVGLVVVVAWRRELLGAAAAAALGVTYVALGWNRFPLSTYVVIAGPLFMTALLFVVSWRITGASRTR